MSVNLVIKYINGLLKMETTSAVFRAACRDTSKVYLPVVLVSHCSYCSDI